MTLTQRTRAARRATALVLATGTLAFLTTSTHAQTDGIWTANGSGNWLDPANWAGGQVANSGGLATLLNTPLQFQNTALTLGTEGSPQNATVSGLVLGGAYSMVVAGPGSLQLVGPAAVQIFSSHREAFSVASANNYFFPGHAFNNASVAGTAGLNVSGPGALTLIGANPFSGPVSITGGARLEVRGGNNGLGSGSPDAQLTLDGGTLLIRSTGLTSARPIFLGSNGGTLQNAVTSTLSGVISGPGGLNRSLGVTSFTATNLTLSGANTYTGPTRVFGPANSQVILAGAGTIATSSAYVLSGTITLDNAAGVVNRLSDTAPITSFGGQIALGGNASAPTSEQIGTITMRTGTTYLTLTSTTAQNTELRVPSVVRENNSTLYVRGTNLGAAPGANTTNVYIQSIPTTPVGAGGAPGSTNQSIVPWMFGATVANATTTGVTFATWDAATGSVRPLAVAEHAPLDTAQPGDNALVSGSGTIPAPGGGTTVNSLTLVATASVTLQGNDVINVTSGAVLSSPNTVLATTTIDVPLNFGSAEGILYNAGTGTAFMTIAKPISGSGGLTKAGPGVLALRATAVNTYTGPTVITDGTVQITGNVIPNVPGPFGVSDTPIVIAPSSFTSIARILANNAAFSIDRDIEVIGDGYQPASIGTTTVQTTSPTVSLTVNGNIRLDRNLVLEPSSGAGFNPGGFVILNGVVSGTGGLSSQGSLSGFVHLNAANTYSGGTEIGQAQFVAGNDAAFGTGPITFYGASTARIAASVPVTIANNLSFGGNVTSTQNAANFTGDQPLTFTGVIDLNGGNPNTGGREWNINVSNTALTTWAGPIINGGFNKTGPGILQITGANTYTGFTIVTAGTLLVNNITGSATGSNLVGVEVNGTLGGRGIIGGGVIVAGKIAPGGLSILGQNPVGTLIVGPLQMNAGSVAEFDLVSPGLSDRIAVAADLTLNGTLRVASVDEVPAGVYTLFTYGGTLLNNGVSLDIAGLNTTLPVSLSFSSPGQVNLVVIPEPAALAPLVLGTLLLGRRRR